MKIDGRRLLVVSASATSVAAIEVLLVAAAHRLRRPATGWPFSDETSARMAGWLHVVLSEALAAFQAELVQRQLRASVAVERALVRQAAANPGVPRQRSDRHDYVVPLNVSGSGTP